MRSLNPKENEKHILIFGSKYKLWRDGEFIGVGTWTQDLNVGDSFQNKSVSNSGILLNEVIVADKWELIINNLK